MGAFHALKRIWKGKKDKFKTTTGDDKPGKTVLGGLIRLSAGLEPALNKIDDTGLKVWDAKTKAEFDKAKAAHARAVQAFNQAKTDYLQFLDKAKRGDSKYDGALAELKTGLEEVARIANAAPSNRNNLA